MSPRGRMNRRDDQIKRFLPRHLSWQCSTGQTGGGDQSDQSSTWLHRLHRSDRCASPVRQVRLTGQTGVAQNTCKNNFKHLLTSSTNQTWWVAFVDDHKQGNEPCTHKKHTQVDRSGSKSNVLEKQLRESNHTKKQWFVSWSSPSTKEWLRLRWGACKEQFPQQVGSLSTTFLLSTKGIFSTKRQDHSPYKLPAAHHNLGS
jgi:hypothetical protein